jgi:hypothetical protein
VIDGQAQRVLVFASPVDGAFPPPREARKGDQLSLPFAPDEAVAVADLR